MAAPSIATAELTFRNNNLEVVPASYDPGDTLELLVTFLLDGAAVEIDNLSVLLTDPAGVSTDVSSSMVTTGVEGEYTLSYYISTGAETDDALIPPGTYFVNARALVESSNVAVSGFYIVNANPAYSPEINVDEINARVMLETALILSARAVDNQGYTLGRFTPYTKVTEIAARGQAQIARNYVCLYVGYDFTDTSIFSDEVINLVVSVIALKTACLIELGFFPEEVRTEKSAYKEYNDMFDKLLEQLVDALSDIASGGSIGSSDDTGLALGGYPQDDGGLVGWQSEW